MLEHIKSSVFAVIMVPVVMAIILGSIYGLRGVQIFFPVSVRKDQSRQNR
ncbi:AcrZ family multidrug efflux pump-associated protein [Salmonella enterica subsp. enterica]|nr:AcrZ family multidrug efflux pump-associated protein [Salmonella enterica subsp. enterica]